MPAKKKMIKSPRAAKKVQAKGPPRTNRVELASVRRAASQPRMPRSKNADSRPAKEAAKSKKNGQVERARLTKADLDHFYSLLLEKRREILGDVGSMESEAFKNQDNHSTSPMHMADVGTDNFEQEFTLGLIESERQLLREIQEALVRIEEGTYGICVATGKPIGKARLQATPWTKYCIEYARMLEQGMGGNESRSEGGDVEHVEEEE